MRDGQIGSSGLGQEDGTQSLIPADSRRLTGDVSSSEFRLNRLGRHTSSQSSSTARDLNSSRRGFVSGRTNDSFEQEQRVPLVTDDSGSPSPDLANPSSSAVQRRPSVISRLGSRFMPRYTTVGSTVEDGSEDGRLLRRRLSNTSPVVPFGPDILGARFSQSSYTGNSHSLHSRGSGRRRLGLISSPIPLASSPLEPHLRPSGETHLAMESPVSSSSQRPASAFLPPSSMTSSRLARARRSISGPFENLLGIGANHTLVNRHSPIPPRRPSRGPGLGDTDSLISSPLSTNRGNLDGDGTLFGSSESRTGDTFSAGPESPDRLSSWTQRWVDRNPSRREGRRMPSLLRGRSSRLIRRDDEIPLSRILQLAAAAIAAQLSGTPDALANIEPIGDDHFDGGLNNFVEELNHAAGAANTTQDANLAATSMPPLNFWRVFRFVNSNNDNREIASRQQSGEEEEGTDGRTVTLVVVGVRSVPSSSIARESGEAVESSLDTLLSLPAAPFQMPRINNTAGGMLGHGSGRSRFPHRRRSSLGGANSFPAQYDSQRDHQTNSSSRPVSGTMTPNAVHLANMSESPPGPHPPPSTPSEPVQELSGGTGAQSPNRRPISSTPQGSSAGSSDNIERMQRSPDTTPVAQPNIQDPMVRQRRRSDSEFARHRDLGAGAARRNGVVEPDDAPGQGRSWLIYVVGTNLSEDHPAFATPSLFTEVITLSPHVCPELTCLRILHMKTCFSFPRFSAQLNHQSLAKMMSHRRLASYESIRGISMAVYTLWLLTALMNFEYLQPSAVWCVLPNTRPMSTSDN